MRQIALCLLLFSGALYGPSTPAQTAETPAVTADAASQSPLVVRVGAIYYDDSSQSYQTMQAILDRLELHGRNNDPSKRRIVFKLAVGTYDEVYHWYTDNQIDLAVLNPGPLALLLREFGSEALDKVFIGARGVIPNKTSVAGADGESARNKYTSLMVVNREAIKRQFPSLSKKQILDGDEAESILDLILDQARKRKTHFFFVHPFSTSGYIFPRKFLKEKTSVDLLPSDFELTYSHDVSVAEILAAGYDAHQRLQVAFVSDETKDTNTDDRLLIIRSDKLKTKIVQDALVLTPKFVQDQTADEIKSVKELVKSITGPGTFNITTPQAWLDEYRTNWWESYEEIGKWIEVFNGNKGLESAEFTVPEAWWKSDINKWWDFYEIGKWIENFNGTKPLMSTEITIDQIIRRINNYNRHHDKPARVALVLSGGGAKCAYQLGAVEVIEEKFKEAQEKNNGSKPTIDLVVGTSGGAINALTIAAEVTKEDAGRQGLRKTWENFGQSEILKPSNFVRRLLGFTLGFIFSLLAINYTYNRQMRGPANPHKGEKNIKPAWLRKLLRRYRLLPWFEKLGVVLLLLSLVLFLLGTRQITLTAWLEAQTLLRWHWFIHIAEYGRQIVRWAAFSIVIFGVFLTFDRSIAARQRAYARLSQKLLIPAVGLVVILFFLLPFATLYTTVQLQNTLFVSSGIDEKMAVEMPNLLGCDGASGSLSERLAQISSKIINQGLIKRDLVITGSVLSSGSASKQSVATRQATNETDLYFIYKADSLELPQSLRRDNRFVSLRDSENASILLDAVIGSGSIFPAFEPKTITKVKRVMDNSATAMKDVSIIDGGFVHNSPIEAAVKLEATHIILIEASPEYPPSTRVNLLSNSIAAFNHLFTQAQLLDARSRRGAEIFTLRPHQEPFLCTVDFGKHYISEAMKYGADDVKDTTRPRFVREPRPPGF